MLFHFNSTMAEVEDQQFDNFEQPAAEEQTEQFDQEEVEADALVYSTTAELPEIKLFGRWSCDDVNVSDMSLAVSVVHICFHTFSNPIEIVNPIEMFHFVLALSLRTIRITLLSKRSTLVICHIQLVVMLPSVSAKHNAQSLND